MRILTICLPENYLKIMERMIDSDTGIYPSVSELIREAVQVKLKKNKPTNKIKYNPDMDSWEKKD